MAKSKAIIMGFASFLFAVLLLLLLLLQVSSNLAASTTLSSVKFLPGFQGPLPFHLETGYVGVGEAEDAQLFYYFVKSERNSTEDPLLLWLTGGPGCTALTALLFEIGPITFEIVEYNGSLPTLVLNPNSWTKVASIIFLDLPVGTGFSYARTSLASTTGDFIQVNQAVLFLKKWLMDHPEFLSNPIYIGGDSYSGITVPAVVKLLSNENEKGIKTVINLKGYLLGNPGTDPVGEANSKIPYCHGMGLISDELYESLERSCGGEYQIIDPSNVECFMNIMELYKCIGAINTNHILEPICGFASPKPMEIIAKRRFLNHNFNRELLDFEFDPFPPLPEFGCRNYGYLIFAYWVNDSNVRKSLHIREGSIEKWVRCNYGLNYKNDIGSSVDYHAYLATKGYRSLIYSGDHDMVVPFLGTQAWIRSLNYSIADDWRPWFLDGQIAGYTRTYSNQMTFATVKDGGHTAPEYRPAECLAMFKRWILQQSL